MGGGENKSRFLLFYPSKSFFMEFSFKALGLSDPFLSFLWGICTGWGHQKVFSPPFSGALHNIPFGRPLSFGAFSISHEGRFQTNRLALFVQQGNSRAILHPRLEFAPGREEPRNAPPQSGNLRSDAKTQGATASPPRNVCLANRNNACRDVLYFAVHLVP